MRVPRAEFRQSLAACRDPFRERVLSITPSSSFSFAELLPWGLVLLAYLLGGLMPGYWLVRARTGDDVREQGSGATGATNVGRKLGPWGFTVVLLLDALKGALAVWLARLFCPGVSWVAFAAAFAVIVGHVWPVFLGFRGGRGVATLLGAWMVLLPASFILCAPVFLVALFWVRRFTIAGLICFSVLPTGAAWAANWQKLPALWAFGCLIVVLVAHKEHLRRWLFPEQVAD